MALPREAIMQIPEKQLVASWRAGDKEAFTLVYARYEQEDESSFVEDKGIVKTVRVVRIKGIYPNSPAFRSGLLPGDKILHLNGTPTFTNVGIRSATRRHQPGEKFDVEVQRGANVRNYEMIIETRPMEIKGTPITDPAQLLKK